MKKFIALILAAVLAALTFASCGTSSSVTIAVPNDPTNEARALLLLQANGYIKLKDGASITATINDIAENPYNIDFKEVEAAQIPNMLKDVDYGIINANYAIEAKLEPTKDSLFGRAKVSVFTWALSLKEFIRTRIMGMR